MNSSTYRLMRVALSLGFIFAIVLQISESSVFSNSLRAHSTTNTRSLVNRNPKIISEPSLQEKNIFILVNVERKKQKLRALKWDPDLWKMAEYYSRKMADEKFFDHLDPDGKSVVDRAKKFKLKNWTKIGENLYFADGYISPTGEAVQGWMNSEGHRENILDQDWTHSAIGVYEARGRKTYVTQLFLRR